ncbi:MAG TPA: alpha-L-fucosidase [Acidimicrobiia bacterium]|nr:alpha-L-fucosidase [Acidimicrobiia bacterium]
MARVTIDAHALPAWWDGCRYGMFVHANLATVPAFAPVHEYADWYWSHLEPRADVILHPTSPLPEVMAHHAEHWPGIAFDDFAPMLTFDRFDADAFTELARDAGMRYLVPVTKHHDGFCFWDSASSERTSTRVGPNRDVIAELADASQRADLRFGLYYSLLDWSHPAYPDPDAYVDAYMRPQIRELVQRFAPTILWGDGHWGHPPNVWRSDAIVAEYYEALARVGLDGVVNDRFWASHSDFMVYEYDVPDRVPDRPWELCRGLSHSFCVNHAESASDHLTGAQVVAMLVETVAKGGHLLLNVGPEADGSIPELQSRALRDAGVWVHAHADVIHDSQPFANVGEGSTWMMAGASRSPGVTRLHVVDTANRERVVVGGLDAEIVDVARRDGRPVQWAARGDGVEITSALVPALATVYAVDVRVRDRSPIVVRVAGAVTRNGQPERSFGNALSRASDGDIVELGAGRYTHGPFPLKVAEGVTVRAGSGVVASDVEVVGDGNAVFELASRARLVGISVTGGAPGYMFIPPTCVVTRRRADAVEVRGCHVEAIAVAGGSRHRIERNVVSGGNITFDGATESIAFDNYQHGLRWGVGIEVTGGSDVWIENNECHDDLCAIRFAGTTNGVIAKNRVETRWFGVHVRDSEGVLVRKNRVKRTMRAFSVEGGRANRIEWNVVEHCDTGVLLERGATATRVESNWLHDCRVGVLAWGDRDTELEENGITEPRDHAVVADSDLSVDGDNLGGTVWRAIAPPR